MPLVNMKDMLYHAYENNYAVGAFDLVSLDFLEAVIKAAERCRSSIILSVAEPHFTHYDFELMLPAVEAAAKRASVPVAIQLDHGRTIDSAQKAINLGCNGVMLDASDLPLPDNIKATKSVVDMAHRCGVPVVGELGYVAGVEGEGAKLHPGERSLTNPSEAKAYLERTGVDFLAVSIGTIQGRMKGVAKLDFHRLKLLNQELKIPLVIHGGSGLNESQFRKMTTMGVVKIDYYTALSDIAAKTMAEQIKINPSGSFTELTQDIKHNIGAEVERCLRIWGSAGRAAEVLTQCAPWRSVEQLIVYKPHQHHSQKIEAILTSGQELLAKIPGVRQVFCGKAIQRQEKYQYCWLIQVTNQETLNNFLEHSDYINFSKNLNKYSDFENILSMGFKEC